MRIDQFEQVFLGDTRGRYNSPGNPKLFGDYGRAMPSLQYRNRSNIFAGAAAGVENGGRPKAEFRLLLHPARQH